MQIITHVRGFGLSDGLSKHLRRRLQFAFDRIDNPVRRVVVRLSDVNGTRGGEDKRCHLQVQFDRKPDVIVEDVQSDLYLAMSRAIERAARTITRRLVRLRQLETQHSARPVSEFRTAAGSLYQREAEGELR